MGQLSAAARAGTRIAWRSYPNQTFAGVLRGACSDGYRLTVEAMVGGEWEWLAWPAAAPRRCRHGYGPSAAAARQAAESAVERLMMEADSAPAGLATGSHSAPGATMLFVATADLAASIE